MAASKAAWLLAAGLLALPPAADAAGKASWNKELTLSAGFSHSRNRIRLGTEFYDRVHTDLNARARAELDRNSARSKWANTLTLNYASSWVKDETDEYDSPAWTETKDQLVLDTVYRLKTGWFVEPYGSGNFQTSVHDTRRDRDSENRAFRPVQARESLGLIFTVLDGEHDELTLRGGWYHQHYLNSRLFHHDPSYGLEGVLEFDGNLGPAVAYEMKAGAYSGVVETDDSWNRLTESRKCALEWENTLTVSLSKYLKIILAFNMDNKDVSSTEVDYEWEQNTSLALSWKVF
ncbi:MAG: hypothetical protein A2234_09355 [Elusimicrobia bacterium RIFOXYA2_FULL_58_8]|nr:MAG: hypothetical protein A2285_05730 [Elusimicrobia bacterium RIFOXYA12_FULL_57_11]OGS13843.1 MAG: hypothetical protein A2234_09355 [Elusimicrobia bacterium RIFOXYA2_FULL_58_8]